MNTKKMLALAMCAVLLVVSTVFVTVAFLTSQDAVQNTFTVGNVVITLDELDVDNDEVTADNKEYTVNGEKKIRDKANAYKLIPGKSYVKDPTIHVAGDSEKCYLFVTVDNGIANIEAAGNKIADQMAAKHWVNLTGNVYYYSLDGTNATAVEAGENVVVFDEFTVDNGLNYDEVNAYAGKTIVVNAYAIQKDGMDASKPADIWGSF
ncbi:MAG: hypothetical protein IKU53_01095 [Firmicutes bacterium]|nr:hypothetical protein [Bacillota bacterium]